METARKMGLKVPEDFSIIGFFDTPWAEHYNMTTFRYRNREIADEVVKQLSQAEDIHKPALVEIDFIERKTTQKYKGK